MPVKKVEPAKKATAAKKRTTTAKTAAAKSATTKKAATARKTVAKGDVYECGVCGLSVVVDEACGCAEVHEIICCEKAMKGKKARVKAKAAK